MEDASALVESASAAVARAALRRLPRPQALALLRDFLTAHAAKDCAIMITLQRLPDTVACDDAVHDEATGACCRFKLAFLDLDLKHAARMPAYVALDRQIQAAVTDIASCAGPTP